MTLSQNNIFGRFYHTVFQEYPDNLCELFWGSLLALGFSPFWLIGWAWGERTFGNRFGSGFLTWVFVLVAWTLGSIPFIIFFPHLGGGWVLLLPFAGAAVELVVGWSIYWLFQRTRGGRAAGAAVVNNTVDLVASVRHKYCIKITWE